MDIYQESHIYWHRINGHQLATSPATPKASLTPSPLIKVPFERVSMDLIGPLYRGIVLCYSWWKYALIWDYLSSCETPFPHLRYYSGASWFVRFSFEKIGKMDLQPTEVKFSMFLYNTGSFALCARTISLAAPKDNRCQVID